MSRGASKIKPLSLPVPTAQHYLSLCACLVDGFHANLALKLKYNQKLREREVGEEI